MITSHLTDTELQLYLTEPKTISTLLTVHMNTCAHCQSRAANYELLITGLKHAAQPVFDFDLAEQVISSLPAKKTPYAWLPAVAYSLGALLILSSIAVAGSRLLQVFTSLPSVLMWLMVFPASVLLVMQMLVLINEYQRKMSLLSTY